MTHELKLVNLNEMTIPKRVPDLVHAIQRLPMLSKLFEIKTTRADCFGTPELLDKYGSPIANQQQITSVRNRLTQELCLFNSRRSAKPQQFVRAAEEPGASAKPRCDFCSPTYDTLTATDTFGRIEGRSTITASNLFKYCGPFQAVAFSKHKHDLYDFDLDELCDYLEVSARWFRAAVAEYEKQSVANDGASLNPMLLWNGGERSGASQKHQHLQLLLSSAAFPQHAILKQLTAAYDGDYYSDLVEAHREVGLTHTSPSASAAIFVSLLPLKNREMVVVGDRGIEDPAFQRLVHAGLRTMIDELGTSSFNLGILPGKHGTADMTAGRVIARLASRGQVGQTSVASDYGGLEVFAGASIGHDDPFSVKEYLDRQLQLYA